MANLISDELKKEYYDFWQNAREDYESRRSYFYIAKHSEMVSGLIKPGRVLDIGIGTGTLADLYSKAVEKDGREIHIIGLDYCINRLKMARNDFGFQMSCVGEAEQIPFGDGSFDQIICWATIPYIQNRDLFLAECRRVLRDGGEVIVNFSNQLYDTLLRYIGPRLELSPFDPLRRHFYLGEVLGCLRSAGFRSISWDGYNVCPLNMLGFLDRTFLRRFGWEFLVVGRK